MKGKLTSHNLAIFKLHNKYVLISSHAWRRYGARKQILYVIGRVPPFTCVIYDSNSNNSVVIYYNYFYLPTAPTYHKVNDNDTSVLIIIIQMIIYGIHK